MKRELQQAIKAHNQNKEVSANDSWNKQNKAGTVTTRSICRRVAVHMTGESRTKITFKDVVRWSRSMLPVGSGYPSQDTTPELAPYVEYLKNQPE